MLLSISLGSLALVSLALSFWQWQAARRFPLHQRLQRSGPWHPAVTVLKPVKGCDDQTKDCLQSWLDQEYEGPMAILFLAASAADPACEVIQNLLKAHPAVNARLVICGPLEGANSKVAKLAQAEPLLEHELVVISDADVHVPRDLLSHLLAPLRDPSVGLVSCLYQLASPSTTAMQWEAIAVNADFWSQVLQSQSLKPLDFALGAAMATRRQQLAEIGGFAALANCLADDYQLGHRLACRGYRVDLCPVVVECRSAPMGWRAVWEHQLRWARTVRACQPAPYFFSLLSNGTLWPLAWVAAQPRSWIAVVALACLLTRIWVALDLQRRMTQRGFAWASAWLVLLKDLLQSALWLSAFLGNRIEWRGHRLKLLRDGTLVRDDA